MPSALIVTAHPGPTSFARAWAQASRDACAELGYSVEISDLYAMGFDPAERAALYGRDGPFDPLVAQEDLGGAPDAQAEAAKIEAADLLVLHFPIWWFAPPAMLKGWLDRALIHGRLHDVEKRFDSGVCRGKTALLCVTTGASEAEVGPRGKEGRLDLQLWPVAYTLRYCGFDIARPVALHDVHGYWDGAEKDALEARLSAALAGQRDVIAGLPVRPRWRFNADADFDETGRLKPGAPVYWPFVS
ncbi:NAD(P)H-dependent oxidoreductase [Pseudoponticoccus marisrubri]|uniref:NADPH:quinone reductase n=1 Tax=Pseudoponticoccus marisrubri TaxID=1685382 RepID=A0A0W7WGI9_9RHOB|nr:NAD(P)H-dependent oxidoreductase [Pseudoponticoccus marisrubri]KUF09747.1 NADPH:quinone reductase [Pseudoponticoccus marisrubri]